MRSREPSRRRRLFVALLGAALSLGCTAGLRGVPIEGPARTGKVVAAAWTKQPGGLRVLLNGQTDGKNRERQAWIAGSQDAFEAVWREVGSGRAPAVNFVEYLVIAEAGEGSVCSPEIIGLEAEASGLLTLRYPPGAELVDCVKVAVPVARVIAVPRRVLPTSVVFLNGFALEVPEVPFG